MSYFALRSRRFNSRSMAVRMKAATPSFSSRTAAMASNVPTGNRAKYCSPLICFLPIRRTIEYITYCFKGRNRIYLLLQSGSDRVYLLFIEPRRSPCAA